jgi:hypothetical protein
VIYILYAKASFSTPQRRNNAFNSVTSYLAQPGFVEDMFIPANVQSVDSWGYKGWPNALLVEVRCRTQSVRDNLWTTLLNAMTGQNAPNPGFAEHWDQLLDAPNPDADTTRYNQTTQTWP